MKPPNQLNHNLIQKSLIIGPVPALLAFGTILLSFVLPMPDPLGKIDHVQEVCIFHALTGLPCPLCGLTRSFVSLSHGHLLQAFLWHPAGPILFFLAVAILLVNGCSIVLSAPGSRLWVQTAAQFSAKITPGIVIFAFIAGVLRLGILMLRHQVWTGGIY